MIMRAETFISIVILFTIMLFFVFGVICGKDSKSVDCANSHPITYENKIYFCVEFKK